jgi:purine-nucleoside phosphorylase
MLMSDHICMPGLGGKHPLVGHNDDNYGVRFPVSLATY